MQRRTQWHLNLRPPLRGYAATPLGHCERPEGARQSHSFQRLMRLLRSLYSLAMTLRTASGGENGENRTERWNWHKKQS
jgi:hypothetical protein